jgi:formylglycine-generating enzyme required for sulfatase activity
VVERINLTDGDRMKMRLELFKWETGVAPRIGPDAQAVVDGQTPSQYDIYLGIMKHRFGTPTGPYGSGTEKEFQDALERWGKVGQPWILFYFNEAKIDPVKVDLAQLSEVLKFRGRLETQGLYKTYQRVRGSKKAFFEQVEIHLRKVISQLHEIEGRRKELRQVPDVNGAPAGRPVKKTVEAVVPPEYLQWLCGQCGDVELLGLEVKQGACLLLDHVYTPLVTSARLEKKGRRSAKSSRKDIEIPAEEREAPQLLLDLLNEQSLYVSGAPGSGKSTFCRWVTWLACKGAMPDMSIPPPEPYREKYPKRLKGLLPVLIRLRDFWAHLLPPVGRSIGLGGLERALEAWLVDQKAPGLTWGCLEAHLHQGSAMIILDGVDEVPPLHRSNDHEWFPREVLLEVLPQAVKQWTSAKNRVLVTSRPYGLEPHHQQRLALLQAPIQAMDPELQALLVHRWFAILSPNQREGSQAATSMIEHLRSQPGLADLSTNPLLLTAMCIIYDEGKRLPADKYELYDRIVTTVLHKRYPPVKERVSEIRGRLGAIAWGMHTGDGLGEKRGAPEAMASETQIDQLLQAYHKLDGATDMGLRDTVRVREDLLSQSGLLLPEGGGKAQFYHLSFQEFLAAERMFLLLGQDQAPFTEHLLHRAESPNWRNTLSFVFGCLVSKFSPHRGVELLRRMVERMQPRLPVAAPDRRLEGGAFWNQAMVLGECLEILLGRKAAVPEDLREFLIKVATQAIDQEIPVKDRHAMAVAMGRLGDPRIVVDLRAHGHPDEHGGYVKISAGRYRYGEKNQRLSIEAPFWLARYPVTNSQFALFIEDDGYRKREFWSREGWSWLESVKSDKPEYWRHPRFGAPNQPVVGVSFWEAEAFATWAGGSLPTEEQWEAAARGPEGHEYPWGGKWEDGICNSRESGLGTISVVGIFPRSRSSPFELEDIAGNVWEWCGSKEASLRVFRGGGWSGPSRLCRAAIRSWIVPQDRNDYLGFRVALVPPSQKTSSGRQEQP